MRVDDRQLPGGGDLDQAQLGAIRCASETNSVSKAIAGAPATRSQKLAS